MDKVDKNEIYKSSMPTKGQKHPNGYRVFTYLDVPGNTFLPTELTVVLVRGQVCTHVVFARLPTQLTHLTITTPFTHQLTVTHPHWPHNLHTYTNHIIHSPTIYTPTLTTPTLITQFIHVH